MALGVTFHPRTPVETFVATLSTTVYLEIRSGSEDLTIFVKDVADAVKLLDAVTDLVAQVAALNAANAKIEAKRSVPDSDTITL